MWAFLVAQMAKNPPAMRDTWIQSLGWEDPWRRAWQPTPVSLPEEYPWTEEPGGLQAMGSQRVGHDWVTKHNAASNDHTQTFYHVLPQQSKALLLIATGITSIGFSHLACLFLCSVETPWTAGCQVLLSMELSQARILEGVTISYFRRSSRPRDWTSISCISFIDGGILYHCPWVTYKQLNLYSYGYA